MSSTPASKEAVTGRKLTNQLDALVTSAHAAYADKLAEIERYIDALQSRNAELVKALQAAETAATLDDEYQELEERAHAEGWDNDPTGSSHLCSAGTRASNAMNLAVQLRRAALSKVTP